MKKLNLYIAALVAVSLFVAAPCFGLISGKVTDTLGNSVSGAVVTFTNEADSTLAYTGTTDADGNYRISITTSVNENHETSAVPAPFILMQNYPNPFNPSTVIPFTLSAAGRVSLTVYNIQGQKVGTLLDGYISAGEHSVRWNGLDNRGRPVSAGVYLYQLRAGGRSETKKMLLLDGGDISSGRTIAMPMIKSAPKTTQSTRLYRITITGEGLIPYILDNKDIPISGTYDFVVPRDTDKVKLAIIYEKDNPLAAVVSSNNGESIGIVADKPSDGVINAINGVIYKSTAGETMTIWFGTDGLPETAISGEWTFKYSNYTTNSVDVAILSKHAPMHAKDIEIDPVILTKLRENASVRFLGKSVFDIDTLLFNDYVAGAIKISSLVASTVGCISATSLLVGSMGTGSSILLPVAAMSCGSAASKAINLGSWFATRDKVTGRIGEVIEGTDMFVSSFVLSKEIIDKNPKLGGTVISMGIDVLETTYESVRPIYESQREIYTITGKILEGSIGVSGVLLEIMNGELIYKVTSNNSGIYSLPSLRNGTYIITPSKVGYNFTPAIFQVIVKNANVVAPDIIAEKSPLFTISGKILENGSGLSGVSVHITGPYEDTTILTDSAGRYLISSLLNGTYTITPSKQGYVFNPANIQVAVNNANVVAPDIATIIPPHGITFVSIPGGTFQMGDTEGVGKSDEKPVHTVTLTGFEMSEAEITNAPYCAFLNASLASGDITTTTSSVKGSKGAYIGNQYIYLSGSYDSNNKCWITYGNGSFSVTPGRENWPVVYVTWFGAKAFAEYYRWDLPREAEWEYACRGGKQYMYGTDDGTINTNKVNYSNVVGSGHPVDVKSYPANPFKLYDMSGNAWEWCSDWYGSYSGESVTDPMGAHNGSLRVVRGGSCINSPSYCRSASRISAVATPTYLYRDLGFRVVRRVSPQNY